jgi:hypothetical protein
MENQLVFDSTLDEEFPDLLSQWVKSHEESDLAIDRLKTGCFAVSN